MDFLYNTKVDKLQVFALPSRSSMGEFAGSAAADAVAELIKTKNEINMIFAAAPSQNEFLSAFTADPRVDFTKINAFHMDEYIGLAADAPQGFGNFLKSRLFGKFPFKSVNYINGQNSDPEAECRRYADLLKQFPCDIVCMGIGENGHIAFNDPPVADFNDPLAVKVVELDMICRKQQVNDGCFSSLEQVPTHALTLTVSALMSAKQIFCTVPAKTKAAAVRETLCGPIGKHCPATVLRRHDCAVLYCDNDSISKMI